ncbi:MAG TPA: diguanylate cyclase [Porticoccus sp.]|nr:diguanylate cyclase [Porticoccus sp.]
MDDVNLSPSKSENILLRFIAWFVPASIKAGTASKAAMQEDPYQTAQIIIAVFLISILSIVGINTYYYLITTPENQQFVLLNAVISLGILFSVLFSAKLFDRSNLYLGNGYAATVMASLLMGNAITGFTWSSPNLPMITFVPMWAFLICGTRSGVFWSFITFMVFISLYYIAPMNLDFPQIFPPDFTNQAHLMAWFSSTILVMTCVFGFQNSYRKLSERLEQERSHFAYQAEHDPLTGLANRKLFYRRANKALDFAVEEDLKAVILYIDLDNFKQVNDSYGHQTGDNILIQTAKALKSVVRSSDTVARLGGDEFGIVLHAINANTVDLVVAKLTAALNTSITIDGITHQVGASIGISVARDHGTDIDTLIQHADAQMYSAKQQKNTATVAS